MANVIQLLHLMGFTCVVCVLMSYLYVCRVFENKKEISLESRLVQLNVLLDKSQILTTCDLLFM